LIGPTRFDIQSFRHAQQRLPQEIVVGHHQAPIGGEQRPQALERVLDVIQQPDRVGEHDHVEWARRERVAFDVDAAQVELGVTLAPALD
jgi:hypothetical protein